MHASAKKCAININECIVTFYNFANQYSNSDQERYLYFVSDAHKIRWFMWRKMWGKKDDTIVAYTRFVGPIIE